MDAISIVAMVNAMAEAFRKSMMSFADMERGMRELAEVLPEDLPDLSSRQVQVPARTPVVTPATEMSGEVEWPRGGVMRGDRVYVCEECGFRTEDRNRVLHCLRPDRWLCYRCYDEQREAKRLIPMKAVRRVKIVPAGPEK